MRLPNQRLPFYKKKANKYEWAKRTIDFILSVCSPSSTYGNEFYRRMKSNYAFFNNELDIEEFKRECDPLGLDYTSVEQLRPYNKTYSKIQVLLGEELRRPFPYRVVLLDSASVNQKLKHYSDLLREYVIQVISPTDETEQPALDPQRIKEYFHTSYQDSRERLSTQLLEYLSKKLDLTRLKNEAFKHGLISGLEILKIDTDNGINVSVINPLEFAYAASPDVRFIEEASYACHSYYSSFSDILNTYGNELTEEEIEQLDVPYPNTNNFNFNFKKHSYGHEHDNLGEITSRDVLVEHVEWKSQRRVGFLTISPQDDEPFLEIVSENFPIPDIHNKIKDETTTVYSWDDPTTGTYYELRWRWIEETWEGTRLGRKLYVRIRPLKNQYRTKDNPYKSYLSYHGTAYSSVNAAPVSVMDRMKPFAFLYLIIANKIRKLISLDTGKIFSLDISMIDPRIGLEKTLYYLREVGIDIFNPLQNADQPGWSQRGKVTSSLDLSNAQHIINYVNLLSAIDQQLAEVSGVNRQREGFIGPSEAVTNAASNAQMSAIITSTLFYLHDKVWERALTHLLHFAKKYYSKNPLTVQYVLDDMSVATLKLAEASGLDDCDVGVFIADATRESELFNYLRSIAQGLLNTNKATFSDMIALYSAKSVEQLKDLIRATEEKEMERQQQIQQQQLEAQQQLQQQQLQHEMQLEELKRQTQLEVAEINSERFAKAVDIDKNNENDLIQLALAKKQDKLAEADIELKELDIELKKKQLKDGGNTSK